ncbi:MAG TPA: class I SAM-dependent methyltransferase [Stellaceae bacterium]
MPFEPDAIHDYIVAHSVREPAALAAIYEETKTHPFGYMQIPPESAQFLQLLVRLSGARYCIELGTFTGYSALALALALPADGKLICCDISAKVTAVARQHAERAGVADKIAFRVGPALATLDAMIAAGEAGRFDFILVDADKANYESYYERGLTLLRAGGLIAIDNVLWNGTVADPADIDPSTETLRALNAKIAADQRVDISMLALGDGLTLARKR